MLRIYRSGCSHIHFLWPTPNAIDCIGRLVNPVLGSSMELCSSFGHNKRDAPKSIDGAWVHDYGTRNPHRPQTPYASWPAIVHITAHRQGFHTAVLPTQWDTLSLPFCYFALGLARVLRVYRTMAAWDRNSHGETIILFCLLFRLHFYLANFPTVPAGVVII